MKRKLLSYVSVVSLLGIVSLTSCSKEEQNAMQFRATMENCTSMDGKTVLDGTALNWVAGDQIAIFGSAGYGIFTAIPQTPATTAVFESVSGETGDGPFYAYYPSTLTSDGSYITLPATQTYEENSIHEFPMYAESTNNQLAFKNLCGVLKLHLTKANTSISSIAISVDGVINGDYEFRFYTASIPTLSYLENGTNTIMLTCTTAQAIDNGKDFYIYLPADTYRDLTIKMTASDGKICTKGPATGSVLIERSKYSTITLGGDDLEFVTPSIEGALPGLFSVSATQQVRFSQGNLQYQASTNTWSFLDYQFDYWDYSNCDISTTNTGWIDLFGWGTGNNPTLHSDNPNSYGTFVDWGVNAISNGGNQPNLWRTLSNAEWEYLFYTRTNASAKYGYGGIWWDEHYFNGLIILPDNWVLPAGLSFSAGMDDFNEYSWDDWVRMENAGAVFLTCAGVRWGTDVGGVGDLGAYWTSTPYGTNDAHDIYFSSGELLTAGYDDYGRGRGLAVRLVCNYN